MSNFRYFISLAFDGSVFHGWQAQKNSETVQSLLVNCLSMMLRYPVSLTGAGRTDAGVHAKEFFAHIDLPEMLTDEACKKLVYKINSFLPPQVAVFAIIPVREKAHARFSAISRTYRYYINTIKNPFAINHSWYYTGKLDMDFMNEAAKLLPGISDFTSFSKAGSDTKTNICKVTEAVWTKEGSMLVFTVTADRFLRNMVRSIVGTLFLIGKHKLTLTGMKEIIEMKNRSEAGDSVPAHGLFLEKIVYPDEIWINAYQSPQLRDTF